MDDRYKDFSEDSFDYDYPFRWVWRNKEYLKLREDRKKEQVEEQKETNNANYINNTF